LVCLPPLVEPDQPKLGKKPEWKFWGNFGPFENIVLSGPAHWQPECLGKKLEYDLNTEI
jgi:hypothetical protein